MSKCELSVCSAQAPSRSEEESRTRYKYYFYKNMDIKTELANFKEIFDIELEKYFNEAIAEAQKKDKLITGALKHVKKMTMSGGKRLRPVLMYYGYLGVGGKEKVKIIRAAISVELIHMFLLIHDDIIDRDSKRHGVETTHVRYKKMHEKFSWQDDSMHFGNSMAIIVGDMIMALGNQALFTSKFESKIIVKALHKLQRVVANTVIGQAKDVLIGFKGHATEREILDVCKFKTAKYTIESPLHLGAILGGANDKILESLSRPATPIGIAFQIQDDILNLAGKEEAYGKEIAGDLWEGKRTLITIDLMEKATSEQREFLRSTFDMDRSDKKIEDINVEISLRNEHVLQVGRRRFVRVGKEAEGGT